MRSSMPSGLLSKEQVYEQELEPGMEMEKEPEKKQPVLRTSVRT